MSLVISKENSISDDDIVEKKTNMTFYRLSIKDGDGIRSIIKTISNVTLPFGLEEYNKTFCINFELKEKKDLDFINLIRFLEGKIQGIFKNIKEKPKSRLRERKDGKILCKGNVKKTKNVIITKYCVGGIETSLFELNKNVIVDITVEISGIWKFNKDYGIYVNIKKIDM